MFQDIQQFVPTHRTAQFNIDALIEELKKIALHGKIKVMLNPDSDAFASSE